MTEDINAFEGLLDVLEPVAVTLKASSSAHPLD